jgi:molybdopterin biosynthesis enzyme MoaB
MSFEDKWKMRLREVGKYINENGKRPSTHDEDKSIKVLGWWISTQQSSYAKSKGIMKNKEIRQLWEKFVIKYENYFLSNEKQWELTLKKVVKYINENRKIPSQYNENSEIKKIGCWILVQQYNYFKPQQIMKNKKIRSLWEKFIKKYQKYFMSNEEQWKLILKKVVKYIDENCKKPSTIDKDKSIKVFGQWVSTQQSSYAKSKGIMKNKEIRQLWEKFVIKYQKYFVSNEEQWKLILKKVSDYVEKNEKRPSGSSKDKSIKILGQWISRQQSNYAKEQYIMANKDIRQLWEEFVKKYQNYFKK